MRCYGQQLYVGRGFYGRGDLVEILPEYQSVELGICVVYPRASIWRPKVRVLINFLAERFAHPPWEQ